MRLVLGARFVRLCDTQNFVKVFFRSSENLFLQSDICLFVFNINVIFYRVAPI